jgi:hypothetical protein
LSRRHVVAWFEGKALMAAPNKLTITATPTSRHAGHYVARLDGDDRVLCVSRTPYFDAARKLATEGYNPNITLVMRHAGSRTECLRASLGAASAQTVEETPYGPKFRRWKAIPTLAVAPRIAPNNQAATTLAAPQAEARHRKVRI